MVTEKEKELIFVLVDMLQTNIELLNKMNKAQGITEETPLVKANREAIRLGYVIAYGNAQTEKGESELLKRNPFKN
jgi:hypothetical protein